MIRFLQAYSLAEVFGARCRVQATALNLGWELVATSQIAISPHFGSAPVFSSCVWVLDYPKDKICVHVVHKSPDGAADTTFVRLMPENSVELCARSVSYENCYLLSGKRSAAKALVAPLNFTTRCGRPQGMASFSQVLFSVRSSAVICLRNTTMTNHMFVIVPSAAMWDCVPSVGLGCLSIVSFRT